MKRTPSRRTPPAPNKPLTPRGVLLLSLFCAAMAIALITQLSILVTELAAIVVASILLGLDRRRFRSLAVGREGESICTFARSFDYRSTDTWIIRAVYEGMRVYIPQGFPLRGSDRLDEDLRIDPDDLDDLAVEIGLRAGRSSAGYEANPMFGRVRTLSDFVHFFMHQPRTNCED